MNAATPCIRTSYAVARIPTQRALKAARTIANKTVARGVVLLTLHAADSAVGLAPWLPEAD